MDIHAHLHSGHSKPLTQELVEWIGNNQSRMDEFMPYFFHEEYRICQRASWTLGLVCEKHPHLIKKWMPELIAALKAPKHDAVLRNGMRALQFLDPIPEEIEGNVYEIGFNFLGDPIIPVAIRVFSMSVCCKIALNYPELIPELIQVIEENMEYGSNGFLSRARKELKILKSHLI